MYWGGRTCFALLSVAAAVTAGCNHVPLDSGAEDVRVITKEEAASCETLGKTHVKVLAKIIGIERKESTMSKELKNLARNAAVDMNGNAVAASSEIESGGQRFDIYRCP
jgi:hypothetical protein